MPGLNVFEQWAEENGIKKAVPLEIREFDGERGVAAVSAVPAGARVLSVPTRLALQVNSFTKAPRWCDEGAWRGCKWDARLAMLLLREKADARSSLQPWLDQLPESFNTPITWPQPTAPFEAIGYPALSKAVGLQREEWDAARARAPGSPSAKEWDWALGVVRSRAFSGPYAPGTLIGSLTQLFGASTLALLYALFVGGEAAADRAFDGFLLAVVFVLCNDFVFGPRITTAKRYVLCPWVDMINHDSALKGSEVAYEYFSDSFACTLDAEGGAVPAGGEVLISYGSRTNDVLLQYYGFVQRDNPFDVYAIPQEDRSLAVATRPAAPPSPLALPLSQEDLILAINEAQGGALASNAVAAVGTAGLVDPNALFSLTADGADEPSLRLGRLLLHPGEATAAESGNTALPGRLEASCFPQSCRALARTRNTFSPVTFTLA